MEGERSAEIKIDEEKKARQKEEERKPALECVGGAVLATLSLPFSLCFPNLASSIPDSSDAIGVSSSRLSSLKIIMTIR